MARRVTVPAAWWSSDEARRTELAMKVGGLMLADGVMLNAWRLSERFFIPSRRGIPWPSWLQAGIPNAVIEVGLAKLEGPEVFVAYVEEVWGWFFKQSWAGRSGVTARIEKYGTAQPGIYPIIDQSPIANGQSTIEKNPIDDPKTSNHLNLRISSSLNLSSSPDRSTFGESPIGDPKGAIAAREILNTVRRNGPASMWISQGGGVDNCRPFHAAPLRGRHSPYGAILGNLACLAFEGVENDACVDSERFPMVPGSASQSESDHVYAGSQSGLKSPGIMPTCASVRQLRVVPDRKDFDTHAQWTQAQYEPLRALSAYRDSIRGRPASYQDANAQALRELRARGHDAFHVAAAIRDVERNGYVGSCAWEVPEQGIAVYLLEHLEQGIARVERLAYQRERRRLAAARGRQRRRFQARAPKVEAFRAAFRDPRARRRELDRIRELYPVVFREIDRASIAELGVAASLWGSP